MLSGCGLATVRADGTVERHYFGYVKVVQPGTVSSGAPVSASDVAAIGLRIEHGVGIGYFHDKQVATPLDCRLVMLVNDRQQLETATRFLQTTLKGQGACAAIF
jgi:hypothetical protein